VALLADELGPRPEEVTPWSSLAANAANPAMMIEGTFYWRRWARTG
jgi:hypothetical protein